MNTEQFVELSRGSLMGRAGLVNSIQQLLLSPGEPRLHCAVSVMSALERCFGIAIPGDQGAVGFTWPEAASGSIGESIERYCGATWDWNELVYATQDELGPAAIGMDRLALYTDEIYARPDCPFVRPGRNLKCYWVEGKSLMTGARAYLPASMIFIPYVPRDPSRSDIFGYGVSSGQACHTDSGEALLSGIFEVIERDAFMLTWMRRISPARIDFRSDPELNRIYRTYFACGNLDFHVFDMTLDLRVPTVLCIARGQSHRGDFLTVGAATRGCLRDAAVKAMKEAVQGAFWARDLIYLRADWRPDPDFNNVVSFEDHVRLYCEPSMMSGVDFIMNTPRSTSIDPASVSPSVEDATRMCLRELGAAGLEAFVVDLTSPEIAELGIHVPKVIVPGSAHLTSVHRLPALASPRYKEVPEKLGLRDPIHFEFNPTPHPFP